MYDYNIFLTFDFVKFNLSYTVLAQWFATLRLYDINNVFITKYFICSLQICVPCLMGGGVTQNFLENSILR